MRHVAIRLSLSAVLLGLAATSSGPRLDAAAPAGQTAQAPTRRPDVLYIPTDQALVNAMLKLADVGPGDVVYDLGSGDGRFVIAAAKLGARGVGVEIDPQRVRDANENVRRSGLGTRVTILHQDLFLTDISEATVVTLYLLPELNMKLRPKLLKELKPGARVVSHQFGMGDWKPDWMIAVGDSPAYLWTIPSAGRLPEA